MTGATGPGAIDARVAHVTGTPRTSYAPSPSAAVEVDEEGWYSVPLDELSGHGVYTGAPNKLHLTAEGVEQPFSVSDGSLWFYGIGLDSTQTDTRTYVVSKGSTNGTAIATSSAAGGQAAPDSSLATVAREDDTVYFSSLLNGKADNFFGSPVTASASDQTLDVSAPAGTSGKLEVSLQGVTAGPHDVAVSLNGTPAGNVTFQDKGAGSLTAKGVTIVPGTNTVTLQSSNGLDVSLTDRISITYPRLYQAIDDSLRATVPAGRRATLKGFSGDDITVLDVTDANAPVILTPTVTPDGGGYQAAVTVPTGGTRTIYATVGSDAPDTVRTMDDGGLREADNAADMVIVTSGDLAASFQDLEAFHDANGEKTRIVEIDDVYDAFGAGEPSTAALRSFFTYADTSWHKAPRFVLLGGDATLDPRGFQGPAGVEGNIVPTQLVDTRFMETASDPWLVSKSDGVALGRMPVRTPEEAQAMVDKTIAYASSPANDDYLMASDESDDGFDFLAASEDVAVKAPAGSDVTQINAADANARTDLLAAIDEGPSVLNYIGHGSVTFWRGGVLSSDDSPTMANTDHPTFFVAMTCLNGYFVDPQLQSLSESMLTADGGAVASWSSTGQTYPKPQVRMNKALYGALDQTATIGEATLVASNTVSDKDVQATWVLLGDPALELR